MGGEQEAGNKTKNGDSMCNYKMGDSQKKKKKGDFKKIISGEQKNTQKRGNKFDFYNIQKQTTHTRRFKKRK